MDRRLYELAAMNTSRLVFFFISWYIYAKSSIHASWTFSCSKWRQYIINIQSINYAVRLTNSVRYLLVSFFLNHLNLCIETRGIFFIKTHFISIPFYVFFFFELLLRWSRSFSVFLIDELLLIYHHIQHDGDMEMCVWVWKTRRIPK